MSGFSYKNVQYPRYQDTNSDWMTCLRIMKLFFSTMGTNTHHSARSTMWCECWVNISSPSAPNLTKLVMWGWSRLWYCQTSVLRLEVDFVLLLSQQQEEQEQEEPPTKYLGCYWPDFDQTLNIGTWEPLEQIPTVTATFVHKTFVQVTFVHMRNISAVTDPILKRL